MKTLLQTGLDGVVPVPAENRSLIRIDRLVKTVEHVEPETTDDVFEVFTDGCQWQSIAAG